MGNELINKAIQKGIISFSAPTTSATNPDTSAISGGGATYQNKRPRPAKPRQITQATPKKTNHTTH